MKRQLFFPNPLDPRNQLLYYREIAVKKKSGVEAVHTQCITRIKLGTQNIKQREKELGKKGSNIWKGDSSRSWQNYSQVTVYFCSQSSATGSTLTPAQSQLRRNEHWERGLPAHQEGKVATTEITITTSILVDIQYNKVGAEGCRHLAEAGWPLQYLDLGSCIDIQIGMRQGTKAVHCWQPGCGLTWKGYTCVTQINSLEGQHSLKSTLPLLLLQPREEQYRR